MMHPIYLPFTEKQLRTHFADVRKNGKCSDSSGKHIRYYKNSLANYVNFSQGKERRER
jgi:hypothetical protein